MGALVLLVALGLFHITVGHEAFLGGCPKVDPMENFEMDKLEGLWYVIEVFEKDVKCMTWTFMKEGNDSWKIYESRQSGVLYNIGLDTPSITAGTMKQKDVPGSYVVSWPLNIAGSYNMVFFYTDYDNVVGIFACQGLLIGHRQQGLILSRKPLLKPMYRQLTKGKLEKFDVETYYYVRVKQDRCGYAGEKDAGITDFGPLGVRPSAKEPESPRGDIGFGFYDSIADDESE